MQKQSIFRTFGVSTLLTIALGVWMLTHGGLSTLWLFLILVILEVTFSFDNAVINSRILGRMSKFWQTLFLTVGILFAVFVVRFVLPIFIVMLASGIGFGDVVHMAMSQPDKYGETLHEAAPIINAFGGTFLMMLGLSYFMDRTKDIHWLTRTEKFLSRFGNYETFQVLLMLLVGLGIYATVPDHKEVVLVSTIVGIVLHVGLDIFGDYFAKKQSHAKVLTGMAAFASFAYLNILDASFSLDGVIGAFAITTNVFLIIAGLGAGALWVRSLTVYLTRSGTLEQYRYMEHGAHWAILALGLVMILKLYHVELPEIVTGSLGLIFIATAVVSSVLESRKEARR